jgi:hypothetical protein
MTLPIIPPSTIMDTSVDWNREQSIFVHVRAVVILAALTAQANLST